MSASDLPNEILLMIVAAVRQCDIIQFSQTCRKFQAFAKQRVQQYRKTEEKYSSFTLDSSTAFYMLLKLCKDPDIRLFPKSLDCSAMCTRTVGPDDYFIPHEPFSSPMIGEKKRRELAESIRAALSSIGYLKSPWILRCTEQFIHNYETSYSPVTPLLLVFFRDLRKVSLPCSCAIDMPLLSEIIDKATHESDPNAGKGALSKLSTVILTHHRSCAPIQMIHLIKIMALPSLRHVKAIDVTWELQESIRLNPRSSGVTSVSLLVSRVSAGTVSQLLENTYALESFTYEAKKWDDNHYYPIVKSLLSHVSETLTHLTMYSRTGPEMSFYALSLMDKLKKLQALGLAQRWVMDTNIQRYFWNSIPKTVKNLGLYADVNTFEDGKALLGEMDRVREVTDRAASLDFALSSVTLDAFFGQSKPEEWQLDKCTR